MRQHIAAVAAVLAIAGCAREESASPRGQSAPPPNPPPAAEPQAQGPRQDPATIEPLVVIDWARARTENRIFVGEVVPPGRGQAYASLRVENTTSRARNFVIATVDEPGITEAGWVLTGLVSCTGVAGKGYIEMLSRFPDGEGHFARTMGRSGPTRMLQGTEPWRPFALPFRALKPHRPSQLVVTVMLPGRGIVELGPLELRQGAAAVNEALGAR